MINFSTYTCSLSLSFSLSMCLSLCVNMYMLQLSYAYSSWRSSIHIAQQETLPLVKSLDKHVTWHSEFKRNEMGSFRNVCMCEIKRNCSTKYLTFPQIVVVHANYAVLNLATSCSELDLNLL